MGLISWDLKKSSGECCKMLDNDNCCLFASRHGQIYNMKMTLQPLKTRRRRGIHQVSDHSLSTTEAVTPRMGIWSHYTQRYHDPEWHVHDILKLCQRFCQMSHHQFSQSLGAACHNSQKLGHLRQEKRKSTPHTGGWGSSQIYSLGSSQVLALG